MLNKNLTYSDAIEKVMLNNGFFAPLKLIYKNIEKYRKKTGKTPDNTIQERVQRDPKFTKIGLGVYALTDYLDKLPKEIEPKNENERKERKHATIQGMLLEIGNFKKDISDTYTNDKNWIFQNKTLGNLATIETIPLFTYEKIVKETVRYIDVIWFNDRGFPSRMFEVEHTTNFRDAFTKFMELQDFIIDFYCIASVEKEDKFNREKCKNAFKPIEKRINFLNYEQIENDYKNIFIKNYL